MKVMRVDNFIYPKTKYVECVLSGECGGRPELLPRVEVLDVTKNLEDLGITSVYRTSFGVVYVYQKVLPFYFVDGAGPSERSISVIESFVDEGFTRVKGVYTPLSLEYVLLSRHPTYYVEIKNNEYKLVGGVKYGKEVRAYAYKRSVDPYSGKITSQEMRFYPPDGDVEVKLIGELVDTWNDFLGEIKRMKKYSNKGIIMKTFDLPGVVNTSRYPPNENMDVIMDAVEKSDKVSFEEMGPVLSNGRFVAKFLLHTGKVISFYPVRTTFDDFGVALSVFFNNIEERDIAFLVYTV